MIRDKLLASLLRREIKRQGGGLVHPSDRQQFAWLKSLMAERSKALAPATFSIEAACQLPAVTSAVDVLATEVASSEMRVEQLTSGDVWEPVSATDPFARLLTGRWSEYETAETAVERLMRSILLYGFCAAYIVRQGATPVEIIPLDPGGVTRAENSQGVVEYKYTYPNATPKATPSVVPRVIPRRDLIFIEFVPAFDRVSLFSPLLTQWKSIRANLGLVYWLNKYWDTGATGDLAFVPGGQVSPETELNNERIRKLMNTMREEGNREFAVPSGYTVQNVSADPRSAALVDLSLLGIQNIARLYRLPPVALQDFSRSTFATFNAAVRALNRTVGRWGHKIALEVSTAIWPMGERRLVLRQDVSYGESFRDLSGGLKDRVFAGIYSQNDARKILGLPPDPSDEANALARTQMLVTMDLADEAGNAPPPAPNTPTGGGNDDA